MQLMELMNNNDIWSNHEYSYLILQCNYMYINICKPNAAVLITQLINHTAS
jgi:hypothetical protein